MTNPHEGPIENSEQPNSAKTDWHRSLHLIIDGKLAGWWEPYTGEGNPDEVTREDCDKIAKGKPWILIASTVTDSSDPDLDIDHDSNEMWSGISSEEAYKIAHEGSFRDALPYEEE